MSASIKHEQKAINKWTFTKQKISWKLKIWQTQRMRENIEKSYVSDEDLVSRIYKEFNNKMTQSKNGQRI